VDEHRIWPSSKELFRHHPDPIPAEPFTIGHVFAYVSPMGRTSMRLVEAMSAFTRPDRLLRVYSVEKLRFQRRQKNCRPLGASFHFGRGGRRNFVVRATKNVLTDLPAIHTAD
jgi:hypothetical protein